jgi:hypothetical protein
LINTFYLTLYYFSWYEIKNNKCVEKECDKRVSKGATDSNPCGNGIPNDDTTCVLQEDKSTCDTTCDDEEFVIIFLLFFF